MEIDKDFMNRIRQIDKEEFEAAEAEKDRIEQIHDEEFKVAVKQLRLCNMGPADELMQRMEKQDPSSKLNTARMAYLNAAVLIDFSVFNDNRFEIASDCLYFALGSLLGVEAEEKP